ncbi:bifunctional aspartate kinase/homoserine dehydrogenase I [Luteimonas sp. e5]
MPQPLPSIDQAHKFGGSSLADASHIRLVAQLLTLDEASKIVVVSAMHGVTDALIDLLRKAAAGEDWQADYLALSRRHVDTASELDPADAQGSARWFMQELTALRARLQAIAAAGTADSADRDAVQGLGEVWSSRLLQLALGGEAAGWGRLDAREVLEVSHGELGPEVQWERSRERLARWCEAHPQRNLVITGFIGRDGSGRATTLGRNGSDWSGAIFSVLFAARELTVWTDVDGVLSADPRLVPDAFCLDSMSYAEALELAYFGAKVLHPRTMLPAIRHDLPIRIRNTFHPSAPGTVIARTSQPALSPVKGLTIVDGLALLDLSGAGMIGVPGTAERLFAALHAVGVSVTMISQGSSEHSICCVIPQAQAEAAREAVRESFADALASGAIGDVKVVGNIAVLAAVGDGMVGTPGVSARLFSGLAQARVNVRAIAQGASERNISVAIDADEAVRALRAAHSAFWLSPATVSIGLIGAGNVGGALLAQLADAIPRFAANPRLRRRLDLRLRGIGNSRRMHLEPRRLDPTLATQALAEGVPLDLDAFADHIQAEHLPHAMIVDCSGSDAVAAHYPAWLARGIHVVTPSKHAGSGDLARYRAIRAAERDGGAFRYEATVGAGLPVIATLRSLLDTGDALVAVEGILSGTLAWLFNRFDGSTPFSQLVLKARELGYTEPDPREDLSGMDVARKLVILAREAGRDLSLADVAIENLVPEQLRDLPLDEFLARIGELDEPMHERLQAARATGRQLRYLAQLRTDGSAHVGLTMPEPGHASLHTRLTDNLVQFHTQRYAGNPLVVQGPGAGAEVTAAGVFGDMLDIARSIGAIA